MSNKQEATYGPIGTVTPAQIQAIVGGLTDAEAAAQVEAMRTANHQFTLEQSWKGWGKLAALRDDLELIAEGLPDCPARVALLRALAANRAFEGWQP